MTDEYKTITEVIGEGFYSEKRSKFLAFAHHVETIDEIKDILASYRKKYYDARHVCYAYVLGADNADFRANDDGEPSSTAGKPILGQINSRELTDILIVSPARVMIIRSLSSVTFLSATTLPVFSVMFRVLTPLPPRLVSLYSSKAVRWPKPCSLTTRAVWDAASPEPGV